MATQEPDRGSRRRWFRLPGQQSDPKEAVREEPEAQLSSEQSPVEPTPTGADEAGVDDAGTDGAGTDGAGADGVRDFTPPPPAPAAPPPVRLPEPEATPE